jgi:hypothetical protein
MATFLRTFRHDGIIGPAWRCSPAPFYFIHPLHSSLLAPSTLSPARLAITELEFLKSLWGLGTEEEEGYRTGPPGYIGWRNSFLGIDSGAPYTFKNTGSV